MSQLRTSEDENEAKAILDALKWKYTARDHGYLRSLDIFKVLHEGDGSAKSILKNCWGKKLLSKIIQKEEDKKLAYEVVSLFEQIYLLTIARIVQSEDGSEIKIKSTGGTSVPTLTKAKSVIDENVSEYLVG